MRTVLAIAFSFLFCGLVVGCTSDTKKCMERDDIDACNEACRTFEEACVKRLELAAAVCAGLRDHPYWKSKEAACSAADEFRKEDTARRR